MKYSQHFINISYHNDDNDRDNNSSYYLLIIYGLPGTVQRPNEVAPNISILQMSKLGHRYGHGHDTSNRIQSQVIQLQSLVP